MAEVVVRPRGVLATGLYTFGPQQLAAPVTSFGVTFDRFNGSQWPTGLVIEYSLVEWSADGAAWQELCGVRNATVTQGNFLPVEMSFQKGGAPLPAGSFARARLSLLQPVEAQVRLVWQ